MFSTNKMLDEFIERFSGNGDLLRNLCNEEKDKISKEIENAVKEFNETKEYMIKEANELFEYNTSNFKQSSKGFKNTVELLKKDEPDYNILKQSLHLDSNTALKRDRGLKNKKIVHNVYRVRPTVNVVAPSGACNSSNILLLHGTRGQNIEGILKEGFKPSQGGRFGPGVYLTNNF